MSSIDESTRIMYAVRGRRSVRNGQLSPAAAFGLARTTGLPSSWIKRAALARGTEVEKMTAMSVGAHCHGPPQSSLVTRNVRAVRMR